MTRRLLDALAYVLFDVLFDATRGVRWTLIAICVFGPLRLTWTGVTGGALIGSVIACAIFVSIVWSVTEQA